MPMESEQNKVETQTPESGSAPTPAPISLCQRTKVDENAGFLAKLRNRYRFSEFIDAPMEERFKVAYRRVTDYTRNIIDIQRYKAFKDQFVDFIFGKKD